MARDIRIEYTPIQMPTKIIVDGTDYPLHQRNLEVVREYEATKDEAVLDRLVTFSIQF